MHQRIAALIVPMGLASMAQAQATALPLRDNRSSALPFLRPIALGPLLKNNQTETTWQLNIANEARALTFPTFYEDGETWRFSYRYRKALQNGHEFSIEAPLIYRGAGIFDPLLVWWHDVIGVPNPARDLQNQGQSLIVVPGGRFEDAFGLGDITVSYGLPTPIADARLWLKLPTGNPNSLLGSGNFDTAFSLDRTWTLSRHFNFDANAGITYQGVPSRLQGTRRIVTTGNLTLSFKQNSKDTWSVHWISESSPTSINSSPTKVTHRLMGLAYTRHYTDSSLTAYFQEDGDWGWLQFNGGATIGPDFTLGLVYRINK